MVVMLRRSTRFISGRQSRVLQVATQSVNQVVDLRH
jgi:hypothetical protein